MLTLDPDVARQASKPLRREAAPHYQAQQRHNDAYNDHEFSELAHGIAKVARIERRHKVESRWQCSLEIITKRSVFRKRPPKTKSVLHFANWLGNIIPM
jgi:hypothetical protein